MGFNYQNSNSESSGSSVDSETSRESAENDVTATSKLIKQEKEAML